MTPEPARPGSTDPRPPRPARWAARLLVGGSVLVLVALATLWVRDFRAGEAVACTRIDLAVDASSNRITQEFRIARAESGRGVIGLTWGRGAIAYAALPDDLFEETRRSQGGGAWRFERSVLRRSDLPFGRDPEEIGPLRTLRCGPETAPTPPSTIAAPQADERWSLLAPCWVFMLPFGVPPLWWAWCPPGRCRPRLTILRLAFLTGATGLVLAGLAAIDRATVDERAIRIVAEFGGILTPAPNPAGTGGEVGVQVDLTAPRGLTDAVALRLGAALREFPNLRALRLGPGPLTGPAFGLLAGLPRLELLSLAGTNADDAALAHLRGSPQLREVDLGGSRVTDAGLAHLGALPLLETLWLDDLPVSDAGLDHLARSPNLIQLSLNATGAGRPGPASASRVSQGGLDRLFRAVPTLWKVVTPDGHTVSRPANLGAPGSRKVSRHD